MEHVKHAAGTVVAIGGGFGWLTLEKINIIGATVSWVIGVTVGCCTLYSWVKSQGKKRTRDKYYRGGGTEE